VANCTTLVFALPVNRLTAGRAAEAALLLGALLLTLPTDFLALVDADDTVVALLVADRCAPRKSESQPCRRPPPAAAAALAAVCATLFVVVAGERSVCTDVALRCTGGGIATGRAEALIVVVVVVVVVVFVVVAAVRDSTSCSAARNNQSSSAPAAELIGCHTTLSFPRALHTPGCLSFTLHELFDHWRRRRRRPHVRRRSDRRAPSATHYRRVVSSNNIVVVITINNNINGIGIVLLLVLVFNDHADSAVCV
jgi:hypothetical protein